MSIHVAFEGVLLQYAKVLMSEHEREMRFWYRYFWIYRGGSFTVKQEHVF